MAQNFFVAENIARTGIELLFPDLVLARTVNRDYESDFGGGKGNVVNVKRPITLTSNSRAYGATTALTVSEIDEPDTVPVTISTMLYSAVKLTDEEMNFDISDFGRQVLYPQVTAVGRAVEKAVADEMESLAETVSIAYDSDDPRSTFVAARKELRKIDVPAQGLYAAVGVNVAADLLNSGKLVDASQSGSTGALRDATIGRIAGFEVFEVNTIYPDSIIFYHRDAFTLAVRAPKVPSGVAYGQSQSGLGFALRWIMDYDSTVLADRSIVSTFIGTETMTKRRWDGGGYVTPAIRVLTDTAVS